MTTVPLTLTTAEKDRLEALARQRRTTLHSVTKQLFRYGLEHLLIPTTTRL
jgi:hypothetical protein